MKKHAIMGLSSIVLGCTAISVPETNPMQVAQIEKIYNHKDKSGYVIVTYLNNIIEAYLQCGNKVYDKPFSILDLEKYKAYIDRNMDGIIDEVQDLKLGDNVIENLPKCNNKTFY